MMIKKRTNNLSDCDFYSGETVLLDKPLNWTSFDVVGKRSRSMDLETELIGNEDLSSIKDEDIYDARDKFMGNILQVPPMFSAIKFKGKSLYNIARKGKTIELKPREVNVSKFEILEINKPYVKFEITCSKGTYIRSIANDLGEELGCGGVLSSLRRTAIGNFFVNDALSIDEFVFLSKAMKAQREKEVSECIQ